MRLCRHRDCARSQCHRRDRTTYILSRMCLEYCHNNSNIDTRPYLVMTQPMSCVPWRRDHSIGVLVPAVVFNTCVYYAFSSVRTILMVCATPPMSATLMLALLFLTLYICPIFGMGDSEDTAEPRGVLVTDLETGKGTQAAATGSGDQNKKKKRKKKKKKNKNTKPNTNELGRPESSSDDSDVEQDDGGLTSIEIEADTDENASPQVTADERHTRNKKMWLFHAIMAFGAFYLAMVLTQWGDYTGLTADENIANQYTSLWVNAVGGWVAYLLFGWIRIAPICCPSRDFSDVRDGF